MIFFISQSVSEIQGGKQDHKQTEIVSLNKTRPAPRKVVSQEGIRTVVFPTHPPFSAISSSLSKETPSFSSLFRKKTYSKTRKVLLQSRIAQKSAYIPSSDILFDHMLWTKVSTKGKINGKR